MPLKIERLVRAVGCVVLLSGAPVSPVALAAPVTGADDDAPAMLGEPYSIDGVEYRPADTAKLDEVGYAGITGADSGVTALHKTLPVPSYVEVTALTSGRTILVRINGRGPRANDRLIDLSCAAARQLGLADLATAPVRVRRVNPPVQEKGTLRAGKAAAERLATPAVLLTALRKKLPAPPRSTASTGTCGGPPAVAPAAPPAKVVEGPAPAVKLRPARPAAPAPGPSAMSKPVSPPVVRPADAPPTRDGFIIEDHHDARPGATPRPAPQPAPRPAPGVEGGFAVQVAAIADKGRASALARKVGGHVEAAGRMFRIRLGPFATEARARAALSTIRSKGFADARMVTNGGR